MTYVFRFGGGVSDGTAGDKNTLGGQGANLAEMASIGLPVPPGFTITTAMCQRYYDEGERFDDAIRAEVADVRVDEGEPDAAVLRSARWWALSDDGRGGTVSRAAERALADAAEPGAGGGARGGAGRAGGGAGRAGGAAGHPALRADPERRTGTE